MIIKTRQQEIIYEKPVPIKDTKENDLEKKFMISYRMSYRNLTDNLNEKGIYIKFLSNSDQVYDQIPNILKSKKQFVVDMNNYYFQNSKRPFKFYYDCKDWDYKTINKVGCKSFSN